MKGYNLELIVNNGEYSTAIRVDGSIEPLEALNRAFWAVTKELYPEAVKGEVANG